MSDERYEIRNYQRIFTIDRRIYSIDGHALPIPGGVPYIWPIYFAVTFVLLLVLVSGSLTLTVLLAGGAALYGRRVGGTTGAVIAAGVVFVGMPVLGGVVAMLDWPFRFLIVPGGVATVAIQVAPDGRKPHRYAASWVDFKLRPRRHSAGRSVSADGRVAAYAPELWVSPDQHAGVLRRSRVEGPGVVRFRDAVAVRSRGRRGTIAARDRRPQRGEVLADVVELADGQRLEVHP